MLPIFFAAHVVVVALLIPLLGVTAPVYHSLPWIFAGATILSLIPAIRRRLVLGSLPWRLAPVLLYAGVISLASSVNPRPTTGVSGNVFHPVEYAGLAFLLQYALHAGLARPPRPWSLGAAALAAALFGVVDELHQSFVPGRHASVLDVGLDAAGAVAGSALFLSMAWLLALRARHRADQPPEPQEANESKEPQEANESKEPQEANESKEP
jgi:VanZ family protein